MTDRRNAQRTSLTVRLTCALAGGVFAVSAVTVHAQQSVDPPQTSVQAPAGQVPQPVPVAAPPYRGLFGAGSPAAPGGHALDLTASVYQEYGNTDDYNAPPGEVLSAGWFMAMRAGLSFEKAGRTARFGLRGDGSFRYYRETRQTTAPRFRLDIGVDSRPGTRAQHALRLGGTVEYEPYYILPIFPVDVAVTGGTAIVPVSRDDLLFRRTRYIYGQTFAYDHQLTGRTYLGVFEEARYTQADTPGLDVNSVRAGVRYGYRFSRAASIRAGYAYQTGRYGPQTDQKLEAHDVDLSLDYRKALTRSRRTTVGFAAGSSRVAAGPNRGWRVVGTANLRHEFERGWFIQGDFKRDVQLVEGFSDPFFSNTVTASLGGFLGRRVEVLTSGGYSQGLIGFGGDTYDAIQGAARLRLALARYLAVDAEGLINQHTLDARYTSPVGVPARLNRWAIRWNVSIWLPLSR